MDYLSVVEQGAMNIRKKGFAGKSEVLGQGKKHLQG